MEDAIAVGIIKRTDIPERCASVLGKRNTDIIGTLCTDIVEHSFGKGHLEFSPEVFEAYREMKAFNGARIYGCDLLAEQRGRFTRMMAMLFSSAMPKKVSSAGISSMAAASMPSA